MKKIFFKAVAAAAVVAATVALSSMSVWALDATWPDQPDAVTASWGEAADASSKDGDSIKFSDETEFAKDYKGKKIAAAMVITFTTDGPGTVTFYGRSNNDKTDAKLEGKAEDPEDEITVDSTSNGVLLARKKVTGYVAEGQTPDPVIFTVSGRGTYNVTVTGKESVIFKIVINTENDGKEVEATNIKLSESDIEIYVGEEHAVTATLEPDGATSRVEWKSDTVSVATVSGGTIKGIGEGNAVITATANGHEAKINVKVNAQKTVSDLIPITAGTYTFTEKSNIAKGKMLFDGMALAVDNLAYKTKSTYAVGGSSDAKIDGFKLKNNGNGEVAVLLPNNHTLKTVVFSSSKNEVYALLSTAYRGSGDLDKKSSTTYNELTYTNDTGADKLIYISADNDSYIGQIVVEKVKTIADTKAAAGTDFCALDTANGNTYIIHPVSSSEMDYTKIALVGKNGNVAASDTVYTSIKFEDGSILNASDFNNAEYIYAVLVTGTEGAAPTNTFEWVNVTE